VLDLPVYEVKPFAKKASKEITSLRAKLADAEGKIALAERISHRRGVCLLDAMKRSSTLEAENAVMREALDTLRHFVWVDQGHGHGHWAHKYPPKEMRDIIEKALSRPPTTSLSDRMQKEKAVIDAARFTAEFVSEEINLSNYDHETVGRVARLWDEAMRVIDKALKELDALTPKGETE